MFKNLGNIANLMKQAQEMQGRMGEMQEKLAQLRVEGNAGGGLVKVEASGTAKILSVSIDQSLLKSDDREMLEDLITAATNQALDKAKQTAADEMSQITGGVDMSGINDMMSKMGLGGGS